MGDNAVPPMKVGYNYPWAFNEYGQNFGPIFFPPGPDGLPRWKKTLPAHLKEFKAMGLSVIRWFILMNGLNYGRNLTVNSGGVIQTIELPKDVSFGVGPATLHKWEFDPPDRLHPFFTEHFRVLLQMFRDSNTGLQLIPSFVDFPFFAVPPDRKRSAGGGRQDVMLVASKRKLFFDTVLEPLLDVSVPFKDQIFAWEVMNEPSWLVRAGAPFGPVTNDTRMSRDALSTFLREALERIEARPEFKEKSTVGHRFIKDLDTLPTGKLRQFHYYAKTIFADDPSTIPDHATTNAFVGELSPEFSGHLFEHVFDQGAAWPELNERDRRDTVVKRLGALASKGYTLAMIWPNTADDGKNGIKLDALAQGSLERYTGTFFIR